jgi:hypothetical protein
MHHHKKMWDKGGGKTYRAKDDLGSQVKLGANTTTKVKCNLLA